MEQWPWWSYRKRQQLRQIEEKILHAAKNKSQTKKVPVNQNHWDLFLFKESSPSTRFLQGNAGQVLNLDGFSLFDGVSGCNPNQTGHGPIPTTG